MVKAVFDELCGPSRGATTVGIVDDVTHRSLTSTRVDVEVEDRTPRRLLRAQRRRHGGNRGTRSRYGKRRTTTPRATTSPLEGSGAVTVSHLRRPWPDPVIVPDPSRDFVACHQFSFLSATTCSSRRYERGLLLNSAYPTDKVWATLPREVQDAIVEKKLRFWVIDAGKVAHAAGMGGRINVIMQTCFFAISGVLPREEAIAKIKQAIEKTYGAKGGAEVVKKNFAAVDATLAELHEVAVPAEATATQRRPPIVSERRPTSSAASPQ
jgi:pyruvate-ferredoxin/flavodoxin oxidoreductase